MLLIRPARNFREGHRYIVALRGMKNASGRTLAPSGAFKGYRDGKTHDARTAHFNQLFQRLSQSGMATIRSPTTRRRSRPGRSAPRCCAWMLRPWRYWGVTPWYGLEPVDFANGLTRGVSVLTVWDGGSRPRAANPASGELSPLG